MTAKHSHPKPAVAMFTGAAHNRLIANVYGEEGSPVLLLHGGGQTRHAWKKTAEAIARVGRVAYALDQRGHGDSDWLETGAYHFSDYATDVRVIARTLAERHGVAPVTIGAERLVPPAEMYAPVPSEVAQAV